MSDLPERMQETAQQYRRLAWHMDWALFIIRWTAIIGLVIAAGLLFLLLLRDIFPQQERSVWINRCDGLGSRYTPEEAEHVVTPCYNPKDYPPHPKRK